MTNLALLCAILLSSFSSCALPPADGLREAIAIRSEEGMLVAVIPEPAASYEEKEAILQGTAQRLAADYGVPVLLTEDLRTYMALARISGRGVSDYEREKLMARREVIARYGIVA